MAADSLAVLSLLTLVDFRLGDSGSGDCTADLDWTLDP